MSEKLPEKGNQEQRKSSPDEDTDGTRYYTPYSSNSPGQWAQQGNADASINRNQTPPTWTREKTVWEAAAQGDLDTLQQFLTNGLKVDQRDNEDYTPLIYAAQEGQSKTVEFLLNNGADINATDMYGWTPLMSAAGAGHIQVVKLLIDRGANPEAKAADLSRQQWETAGLIAARRGHDDIVQLLKRVEL